MFEIKGSKDFSSNGLYIIDWDAWVGLQVPSEGVHGFLQQSVVVALAILGPTLPEASALGVSPWDIGSLGKPIQGAPRRLEAGPMLA